MSESRALETALKILPVVGACITFAWGVWVWQDNAGKERDAATTESARHAESRRIEATRPFLEMQLKLYTETAQVVSKIANASDPGEVAHATQRFWELYTGELSMVEDAGVATAMVAFGSALERHADQRALRGLGVKLAHGMRESLAASWGTDAWQMRPTPPRGRLRSYAMVPADNVRHIPARA